MISYSNESPLNPNHWMNILSNLENLVRTRAPLAVVGTSADVLLSIISRQDGTQRMVAPAQFVAELRKRNFAQMASKYILEEREHSYSRFLSAIRKETSIGSTSVERVNTFAQEICALMKIYCVASDASPQIDLTIQNALAKNLLRLQRPSNSMSTVVGREALLTLDINFAAILDVYRTKLRLFPPQSVVEPLAWEAIRIASGVLKSEIDHLVGYKYYNEDILSSAYPFCKTYQRVHESKPVCDSVIAACMATSLVPPDRRTERWDQLGILFCHPAVVGCSQLISRTDFQKAQLNYLRSIANDRSDEASRYICNALVGAIEAGESEHVLEIGAINRDGNKLGGRQHIFFHSMARLLAQKEEGVRQSLRAVLNVLVGSNCVVPMAIEEAVFSNSKGVGSEYRKSPVLHSNVMDAYVLAHEYADVIRDDETCRKSLAILFGYSLSDCNLLSRWKLLRTETNLLEVITKAELQYLETEADRQPDRLLILLEGIADELSPQKRGEVLIRGAKRALNDGKIDLAIKLGTAAGNCPAVWTDALSTTIKDLVEQSLKSGNYLAVEQLLAAQGGDNFRNQVRAHFRASLDRSPGEAKMLASEHPGLFAADLVGDVLMQYLQPLIARNPSKVIQILKIFPDIATHISQKNPDCKRVLAVNVLLTNKFEEVPAIKEVFPDIDWTEPVSNALSDLIQRRRQLAPLLTSFPDFVISPEQREQIKTAIFPVIVERGLATLYDYVAHADSDISVDDVLRVGLGIEVMTRTLFLQLYENPKTRHFLKDWQPFKNLSPISLSHMHHPDVERIRHSGITDHMWMETVKNTIESLGFVNTVDIVRALNCTVEACGLEKGLEVFNHAILPVVKRRRDLFPTLTDAANTFLELEGKFMLRASKYFPTCSILQNLILNYGVLGESAD